MRTVCVSRYLLFATQHMRNHGYLYEASRLSELNNLLLTKLQVKA